MRNTSHVTFMHIILYTHALSLKIITHLAKSLLQPHISDPYFPNDNKCKDFQNLMQQHLAFRIEKITWHHTANDEKWDFKQRNKVFSRLSKNLLNKRSCGVI